MCRLVIVFNFLIITILIITRYYPYIKVSQYISFIIVRGIVIIIGMIRTVSLWYINRYMFYFIVNNIIGRWMNGWMGG